MAKKHGVKMEYNQITPMIYVGSNSCCQMHFKKELLEKGIRADISLEEKRIVCCLGGGGLFFVVAYKRPQPTKKTSVVVGYSTN